MSQIKSRIRPEDAVVLFVDLQSGIVELSRTNAPLRLGKSVAGLAKLASVFGIPAIVSGVASPDGAAPSMIPELQAGLGNYRVYQRRTADSFRNEEILAAIAATGRRTLLLAGVSTEVAVQLPALTATDMGYRVFVVIDASGGMTERTEQAAIARIHGNGGSTVSVMTLAGELAGDFGSAQAQTAIAVLYEMATA
jgi:nicotinamidase-related amidase